MSKPTAYIGFVDDCTAPYELGRSWLIDDIHPHGQYFTMDYSRVYSDEIPLPDHLFCYKRACYFEGKGIDISYRRWMSLFWKFFKKSKMSLT